MSRGYFATQLPGSNLNHRPLKECGQCKTPSEPGSGIELGPGRWHCAKCWIARSNPGNNRK